MKRLILLLTLFLISFSAVGAERAEKVYRYAKRGYFGSVNANYILFGEDGSFHGAPHGVSVELINGYSFNHWFMLGGGIGTTFAASKGYGGEVYLEAVVPVFVHTRFNILDRRVTPFFSLSAGAGIFADNINKGVSSRLYIDPKAGVAVYLKDGKMIDIGVSYLMEGWIYFGGCSGIKLGVGFTW